MESRRNTWRCRDCKASTGETRGELHGIGDLDAGLMGEPTNADVMRLLMSIRSDFNDILTNVQELKSKIESNSSTLDTLQSWTKNIEIKLQKIDLIEHKVIEGETKFHFRGR